jgi:hypothetical protein
MAHYKLNSGLGDFAKGSRIWRETLSFMIEW